MNDRRWVPVIVALASGISAVASSFALYATSERFLVSAFNRHILEYLPGWFVSSIIQRFGDFALELSLLFSGVVLSVVVGAVALAGARVGSRLRQSGPPIVGFALATGGVFAVTVAVVGELQAAVVPALIGGIVVTYLQTLPWRGAGRAGAGGIDSGRRSLVRAAVGVAAFNVVAHGVGLVRREQTQRAERDLQNRAARLEADHLVSQAEDGELEAEGIKPLITDVESFFKVDINASPPAINAAEWRLSITGLVEEELEFDYDDVREEEVVHQYKAIRCLSDDIDGDQLDTAVWTGCTIGDLLEEAEPQGEYAMLYGADDYFYSISVDRLEECLLAYGMNGMELPTAHGYPVRVLVPDRWGKLHVKWLTGIEIIDAEEGGYWEERGWHGMGPVNAVTKIDRINRPGDLIQVVGHAYAGARGVDAVEVSLDGGDSWEEAVLSEDLPDPDTTRQWVYEIDPDEVGGDSYELYARTVDGEGEIQTEERAEPFPDGATGWAQRSIEP